ncbi:MAG: preprotein translocase subunit SecE [Lachnospiraceae bacterium]|nr:preprotein translocase subunit SecE [Lachnospiraceae bacterium]
MGDAANEKAPKTSVVKSWFKGLKSEFKKIIWPDKKSLGKQTLAVIIITAVLSVIIALLDAGLKIGIDKFIFNNLI